PELIKVVIYGSVTSCLDDFREQISWLKNLSFNLEKKLVFIFIGNNGIYKSKAEEIIKQHCGMHVVESVGFVSQDIISHHLCSADIGISRADSIYLGKSGTTISMLEHGLPVLLKGKRPTESGHVENTSIQRQLFYPDDPIPQSLLKYPKNSFLPIITDQYIQYLKHASGE
ncbi:MAG: hypothetical protein ACK5XN_31425, partial [Bacteroidota bacterium]